MPQNNPLPRASTTIILLLTLAVVLTLTACGPSTPAPATVTPTQTTAAPTPTQAAPSPTKTQLPPTATQARTPTSTPVVNTPTATAAPTFIAETPLNAPGKYRLADWDQQVALDAISILDQQWNKIKEEDTWVHAQAGINEDKKVVALVEQEAILHEPELPSRKSLEWKIALDLATAGKQNATDYLAALLQFELNQSPSLLADSFLELKDYGFTFKAIEAADLLDEKLDVWLIEVRINDIKENLGGGGAVFSIHKNSEGKFLIYPVGGYWFPYSAATFDVYFNPTKPGTKPEVSIAQSATRGSGLDFTESWLCNYQWQGQQWMPSLINTKGEISSVTGIDSLHNRICFVDRGGFSPVFLSENNGKYIDTIQSWRGLDAYSCDWNISYTFHKEKDIYQQQTVINNIAPKLSHPTELYCLETIWNLADIIENKEDIILYMENLIADWSDLINRTWDGDWTIEHASNPDFYNQLQFELGRFYALAGELDKAKAALAKIANSPPGYSDHWTYIAHHYLENLDNIDQAEEGLTRDLSSLCRNCSSTGYVKPIYEKAVSALYTEGSLDSVKDNIQTLIADANPSCYGGDNYECAELLYLHGLANELDGNTSEAVTAYWLVWHHYPKSLYAIAAQQKLELVKKP